MRQLAGLMLRHAHGVTEGVVRNAVHYLFIRKSQNGIVSSLTDGYLEFASFYPGVRHPGS